MDPVHQLQAGQLQILVPRQPFPASPELAVHHVTLNTLCIQLSMQALPPFSCSQEAFWGRPSMLWRTRLVTGDTEQKSFDKSTEVCFFGDSARITQH